MRKIALIVIAMVIASVLMFGCAGTPPQPSAPQPNSTVNQPVTPPAKPPVVTPPVEEKDTTPPALLILTPKDGNSVDVASVNVSGSTEAGAMVTINNQGVAVDTAGLFSKIVYLKEGSNKIDVVSADSAGNKIAKTVTVIYTKPVPPAPETPISAINTSTNVTWESGMKDTSGIAYDQASVPMSVRVGDVIGVNAETSTLVFGGVPPGAESVKRIALTNYKSTPVKVKMHVEGQLKDWTTTPDDFTLAGGETQKIGVKLDVPQDAAYGNYSGTFVFEFYN